MMTKLADEICDPLWWIVAAASGLGLWLFGWWGLLAGPVAFMAVYAGLIWQMMRDGPA